jgi:hypothetical protein
MPFAHKSARYRFDAIAALAEDAGVANLTVAAT